VLCRAAFALWLHFPSEDIGPILAVASADTKMHPCSISRQQVLGHKAPHWGPQASPSGTLYLPQGEHLSGSRLQIDGWGS
jgi:hypothetical protein